MPLPAFSISSAIFQMLWFKGEPDERFGWTRNFPRAVPTRKLRHRVVTLVTIGVTAACAIFFLRLIDGSFFRTDSRNSRSKRALTFR